MHFAMHSCENFPWYLWKDLNLCILVIFAIKNILEKSNYSELVFFDIFYLRLFICLVLVFLYQSLK